MQFKNPEILYFLFALALPILVHLFQLKKFSPQVFTNVAFLKEISLQTRKSSQLEKWLLLVCRLFLLTTLIIAFAQPYFPAKQQRLNSNTLVIVLDNSLSMQAKGAKGELLPNAIQELLESIPANKTFSLVTNTNTFWDVDMETVVNDLQNITYNSTPFQPQNILNTLNNRYPTNTYDLLVISDGKITSDSIKSLASQNFFYKKTPVKNQNVSINKVELDENIHNFNALKITIQGFGITDSLACTLSVADTSKVFNKSKIWVKNNTTVFTVNLPKQNINGKISIDTDDLKFDNDFYFSISAPEQITVGIIGDKIPEIENLLSKQKIKTNYIVTNQDFQKYHTLIVNQENQNLNDLGKKLKEAYNQGAQIIYIPNTTVTVNEHNELLSHFGALKYNLLKNNKTSITNIHFEHPLYKNVFNKKPENFNYPSTLKNYTLNGSITPILSYPNQEIYLGNITNGVGNLYIFTSGFKITDSDILQAPIIVPTLYNMIVNNQTNQLNNVELLSNNTLLVDAMTNNDKALIIKGKSQQGIIQQQPIGTKTKIFFNEFPTLPGNYSVIQNDKKIADISLNHSRIESDLTLPDANIFNNFVEVTSIDEALNVLEENRTGTELWKYFILTTLLFLILELLIQKFVK